MKIADGVLTYRAVNCQRNNNCALNCHFFRCTLQYLPGSATCNVLLFLIVSGEDRGRTGSVIDARTSEVSRSGLRQCVLLCFTLTVQWWLSNVMLENLGWSSDIAGLIPRQGTMTVPLSQVLQYISSYMNEYNWIRVSAKSQCLQASGPLHFSASWIIVSTIRCK